jgi:hypothetical protein
MLTETILFRKLRRGISSAIFDATDPDYFISILNEESLATYSTY